MDLDAVRTFVAAADAGQFSEAATDLSITQHAVSKRIAALEKDLGVPLFTRTARGAQLTIDGQAFLPHARGLLQAEERAAASVRPGRRALRVDVIARRLGTAGLLRDFHRAHPRTELDVVTLFGPETPSLFAASTLRNTVIFHGLACSPCVTALNNRQSVCRDNQCMKQISVEQVLDATVAAYHRRNESRAALLVSG